jgi:hypothetical protein
MYGGRNAIGWRKESPILNRHPQLADPKYNLKKTRQLGTLQSNPQQYTTYKKASQFRTYDATLALSLDAREGVEYRGLTGKPMAAAKKALTRAFNEKHVGLSQPIYINLTETTEGIADPEGEQYQYYYQGYREDIVTPNPVTGGASHQQVNRLVKLRLLPNGDIVPVKVNRDTFKHKWSAQWADRRRKVKSFMGPLQGSEPVRPMAVARKFSPMGEQRTELPVRPASQELERALSPISERQLIERQRAEQALQRLERQARQEQQRAERQRAERQRAERPTR